MTTITGFSAVRMQAIEDGTIVDASIVDGHLILLRHDGTPVDAGLVDTPSVLNVRTITDDAVLDSDDDVVLADATGLKPPGGLQAEIGAAGGLTGQYIYVVTATAGGVEGTYNVAGRAPPVLANQKAVITWEAVPGATGYKVYRSGFDFGDISTADLRLIATLGNVLTYIDSGGANTSEVPPQTNGAAFTITLPSAVGFTKSLKIRATGLTRNLITLDPTGAQTIDGLATLQLGLVQPAAYQGVTLVSDGTNWVISDVISLPFKRIQKANVYKAYADLGAIVPCVVIPCPPLIPDVTRMTFMWQGLATPGPTTNILTMSVNRCDADGVYDGNVAYESIMNIAPGAKIPFSGSWNYDPRLGDVDLGDGSGIYIGLHMTASPTDSSGTEVTSAQLIIDYGAIDSEYWPNE